MDPVVALIAVLSRINTTLDHVFWVIVSYAVLRVVIEIIRER